MGQASRVGWPIAPVAVFFYELHVLFVLYPAGEDGVDLDAHEHHEAHGVEPEHKDYYRPELAVDPVVVAQPRGVEAERDACGEHQHRRREAPRRDPLERDARVGGQVVEDAEGGRDDGEGYSPARPGPEGQEGSGWPVERSY